MSLRRTLDTAKDRVLKRCHTAVCLRTPNGGAVRRFDVWHRIDTVGQPIGSGGSPLAAWVSAENWYLMHDTAERAAPSLRRLAAK